MGLVPAGTGNLLARTVGTPDSVLAAARVALTGDDRKIDVGRIRMDGAEEERVFLVMAGTGFDAAIMENTPETLKVRVGPLAYVISGLRAMRGRRIRVTLTLDDGPPLRRRTRTVLVGNSGTLLGGLVLMPRAAVDDGVLDVVSLAPSTIAGWIAVRPARDHATPPGARARRALAGSLHRDPQRRSAAVPAGRRPDRRGHDAAPSASIRARWSCACRTSPAQDAPDPG